MTGCRPPPAGAAAVRRKEGKSEEEGGELMMFALPVDRPTGILRVLCMYLVMDREHTLTVAESVY